MRLGSRPLAPATWLLSLGLVLCAAVYYPGLHGDFVFDDVPNIVQNTRLHVDELSLEGLRAAAVSVDAGALKRPVSMLSFWVNYYTTGLDPFYFKLVNLLIHLVNGVGLFWLTRLLLDGLGASRAAAQRDSIALVAALIWLLHPLNLTSVLYVVQRMTSLSATFTILGLVSYLLGRQRLARGEPGFPLILLGLVGFGSLAVFSKENGVLLPLFMAVIELGLLRFSGLGRDASRKLKAFFLVTVGAPLAAGAVFVLLNPGWITEAYTTRSFTLAERLLTEARVLWLYVAWIVAPTRASLGLYHDDVAISHGLLDPPTTVIALAGIVAVCAAAIRFRKEAPLLLFAVGWYLVGHLLESSVIPLELVHEHRNYLPMFGPVLAGAYCLWLLAERFPPRARFALPAVFLIAFTTVTLSRSLDWGDPETLQVASARDHPNSVRANYEAGTALGNVALRSPELAPIIYDDARAHLERAAALDETVVAPLFGLILLDASASRPVDEASIDRLEARLATMPLRFTVVEPFRSFVEWNTKRVVVLPERLVLRLFEAAIDNPTADHRTRAMLFSLLSSYWHNVAGNEQEAVNMAVTAIEEDPSEPAHHISLANLAVLLGNFDVVAREIDAANRADTLGRWTVETRRLSEVLEAQGGADALAVDDLALR